MPKAHRRTTSPFGNQARISRQGNGRDKTDSPRTLAEKQAHYLLAQNSFRYSDGACDIDYTALPVAWTINIAAIAKNHAADNEVKQLLNSFLMDGRRSFRKRTKQQRVINHDRLNQSKS